MFEQEILDALEQVVGLVYLWEKWGKWGMELGCEMLNRQTRASMLVADGYEN